MPRRDRPFWYMRRRPRELDAELDAELRAHLDMRIDDLIASGMPADAARQEALRQFGDVEYTRRYCRIQDRRKEAGMRWNLFVDELARDVRHGLRQIVRTPGFTAIVVLTLALGVGANTALFSIFNSLILRTLPVRDPGSLALLQNGSWSYPIWDEVRARENEFFDGALAWSAQRFDLSTAGKADVVDGAYVNAGFFDVLGVAAVRGRMLTPADDAAAPDGPVAVISHRFWQERFGGANDVAGRRITVQRVPFTIAGVMPAGFFGPDVGRMTDVILPVRTAEPLIRGKESRLTSPGSSWLQIMVRLKPGQSLEQANAALSTIHRLTELESARSRPRSFVLVPAATGNSALRRRFETPLRAMVIAVGLVLLVACGNIASLMLARTMSRRREFSVRLALGSSRARIARLLFIESLLVAVMGAALGLVFAVWGSAFLVQQLNTWQSTVSLDLVLDRRVLAFTAALACLSAIVAGVVPSLGFTRVRPGDTLKDGGRGIAGDTRLFVRGSLVVVQIAVSCVLVVGAGLFLRTFASLNQLPLGFVPESLLVAELNLQTGGGSPESRVARVERLREAAAAVPGVRSASVATTRILSGAGTGWSNGIIGIDDRPMVTLGRPGLWLNATTPGWFETMGIPLRSGRDFEHADRAGSGYVAIVNEAFVRRFLPAGQPLGHTVVMARSDLHGFDANARFEIVGVAADAVYTTPREGMMPVMYVPMTQRKASMFWESVALTIRAAPGNRAAVERDLAAALTNADPAIAYTFGTFDQLIEATVTQERLIALLSAFFGGLALLLAALGLYGLVSHSVRARLMEIGLRMAMGADASSIVRLVFRRVGLLIAAGLVLGLAGSLWGAKFVGALLFRLDARDPMTFLGAAAVLVVVGVLAAWLPARRAARVDPITAMRSS